MSDKPAKKAASSASSVRQRGLGDLLDAVPEGAQVIRPDGAEHTVTGGLYLLDVPGVHTVNGVQYRVK